MFVSQKKSPEAEKGLFSKLSFLMHIYLSRQNFFVFIKISYLQRFREIMGGTIKRQFLARNDAAGQKNDFFRNFLFCCTSTYRDETFLFLSKFHIFSRSEKSWGDKQNVNFRLKTTRQAKKMTIYEILFSSAHLLMETNFVCLY